VAENMMNYLDSYCERAGQAGALAEPMNLLTNGFFILAALMAVYALLHHPAHGRRIDLWLLVIFLFSIGVGSGLWHWHPSKLTVMMDVIPITLFINTYIIAALRRLFKLSWARVLGLWAVYFVIGIAAQRMLPITMLNGSILYMPTFAALLLLTLALWRVDRAQARAFTAALVVLTVSLFLRTVDMKLCPQFSTGTHFLWHTLNAWVLWRLLMVLIRGR